MRAVPRNYITHHLNARMLRPSLLVNAETVAVDRNPEFPGEFRLALFRSWKERLPLDRLNFRAANFESGFSGCGAF